MKKTFFLLSMITVLSCFSSCSAGYVSEEPTYVEISRPARPSESHIWIEGDWIWNSRKQNYERNNSYWSLRKRDKNYNKGYWRKGRNGYRWIPGNWR